MVKLEPALVRPGTLTEARALMVAAPSAEAGWKKRPVSAMLSSAKRNEKLFSVTVALKGALVLSALKLLPKITPKPTGIAVTAASY